MEFDRNKILTVVTADQLKEGQMGWINDCVDYLKSDIKNISPYKVFRANENMPLDDFPFAAEGRGIRRYFYPAPEPTYAERQAQWVKENNVKEGTRLRVTRGFKENEGGSDCGFGTDGLRDKAKIVGQVGKVDGFADGDSIYLKFDADMLKFDTDMSFFVPYTVLEVVPEEPWFKLGDKVRITIKSSEAYDKIGTVTNTHVHRDGTQTIYLSFEEFLDTKAFNADSKEKIGELYAPTYGERQEEWIKKHNLKEGDEVKVLRTAKDGEDGWNNIWTETMSKMVGTVFTYGKAYTSGISLSCGYIWPYFVLEVVKEPTYRPYNNDELNDLVGEVLTSKFSGRRKLVTGRPKQKTQVNLDGKPFTAEILLQYYYRNKTEPCGIKEEV